MQRQVAYAFAASCLFLGTTGYARTRAEVASEAQHMLTTPPWTVRKQSVVWPSKFTTKVASKTFKSNFSGGNNIDWPYVYGGRETRQQTVNEINEGTKAPGGYNITTDTSSFGLQTYDFYWANHPDHPELYPHVFLAGVDCAGFVYGALHGEGAIPSDINTNAAVLVSESVLLDDSQVQIGDLLAPQTTGGAPDHVQIVTALNPLTIMEAAGNPVGKVQEVSLPGGVQSDHDSTHPVYLLYSPFPILTAISPQNNSTTTDTKQTIDFTICTAKTESRLVIDATLDGNSVVPSTAPATGTCNGDPQGFTYRPPIALSNGTHTFTLAVQNPLLLETDAQTTFVVNAPNNDIITVLDTNRHNVPKGSYTNSTTVDITVTEPSGLPLSAILVDGPAGPVINPTYSGGELTASLTLPNLAQGAYIIAATDQKGNTQTFPFTVETAPPTVSASDGFNRSLSEYGRTQAIPIKFTASPSLADITSLTVFENNVPIDQSHGNPLTIAPRNLNGDWLVGVACGKECA